MASTSLVDHDRRPERRPSVHDPVPGDVDGPERVERVIEASVVDTPVVGVEVDRGRDRVVVLDHAQLQAGRAGVDDEQPHEPVGGSNCHDQPEISGGSSPCSRVYKRAAVRASTIC